MTITTKWLKLVLGGIALLTVTACSVTPKQMTYGEVRDRVSVDQMRIYVEQELIFKPITFEEAVARSLKYNLDYRLKMMESALSAGILENATYDTLPKVVASAGYTVRNNYAGGNGLNLDTGVESTTNSTSTEKNVGTASLQFTWNALDFGMTYYRTQQRADEYLISEERRKRVIQNILMDVRSAYWRAVGAQRLLRKANELSTRVNRALMLSREAESQGLMPPKEALTYQRLLLDSVALIAARRQELAFAKRELSALLNITPGTEFSVVETDETALLPVPYNISELEEYALTNRPELREEDYRKRITAVEAKRAFASLFPGISFNTGLNYDSNEYTYNNTWIDTGVQVSFDLLSPLSIPAMRNAQHARIMNDEGRRLSLTMAIVTQVRLSIEQYRLALNELEIARQSSLVDQRLAAYARAAATSKADTELELIRAETRALNSEYQRYAAYAEAQASFGRIYNSIGLEVVPEGFERYSISELSDAVASNIANTQAEVFATQASIFAMPNPVTVRVNLTPQQSEFVSFRAVRNRVEEALERNDIRVSRLEQVDNSADAERPRLELSLEIAGQGQADQQSYWYLELFDGMGNRLGYTRYKQKLAVNPTSKDLVGFAESSIVANIDRIIDWLGIQMWGLSPVEYHTSEQMESAEKAQPSQP